MPYRKAFFELQLDFARRVAQLSGASFERALLDYTNIYVRLAIGREFDAAHPVWMEYLAGMRGAVDPGAWTRDFIRAHPARPSPSHVARSGCFACDRAPDGSIHIHFSNAEPEGHAPLAAARRALRLQELRDLFAHVAHHEAQTPRVVGCSWLYNLPAYRGLFPESYIASATVARQKFRNMPLWGQFLDRNGGLRPEPTRLFRDRLTCQAGIPDLAACFPLQPLLVSAPFADFAAFHHL